MEKEINVKCLRFSLSACRFGKLYIDPYIKTLAFKIGAIDKPDNRKVHKKIMPRLGGLAIYIAFMIAAVASLELTKDIVGILLGGSVIAS